MDNKEVMEKMKRLKAEIERENFRKNIAGKKAIAGHTFKEHIHKFAIRIFLACKIASFIAIALFIVLVIWMKQNPLHKEIIHKTPEQRVRIITQYIVENMVYNYIPGIKYNVGADSLERGGAVCDGYTRAFQRLAFLNGIPSKAVCGVAGTISGLWIPRVEQDQIKWKMVLA